MRLIFFGFITGYLLGSIPFAWIAVWLFKRIDMRNYGTRTVSATMVGVLISKPIAAVIGCLDILKGLIPVYFGKIFLKVVVFSPMLRELALFSGTTGLYGYAFRGEEE
ncbi:MAG: glycerol-3-phosphate acyltransferase [candidate division WOR-3 bacterium]